MVASYFMEDFEEGALSGAIYKPRSCLRYVDNTFIILHTVQKYIFLD
jgi:hypothetical protein